MRKTDDKVLIAAMRILAQDIVTEDGVANSAIAEAADRLEELSESLLVAHAANRTSDAAFTRIVECAGLEDVNTLNDLVDYIVSQKTTIDALEQAVLKHVSENSMNHWVKIDYEDRSTWPEQNEPVLIAWHTNEEFGGRLDITGLPDFPYTSRKQFFINEGRAGTMSWFSSETQGFYEGIFPTHWMYAPEYKP